MVIPVQIIPFRPTTSLIMHITHHGCNNIWIIAFSKIRLTVFSYCKSFRSVDFTKFPSGSESRLVANYFLSRERENCWEKFKTCRSNFSFFFFILTSNIILSIDVKLWWNASKQLLESKAESKYILLFLLQIKYFNIFLRRNGFKKAWRVEQNFVSKSVSRILRIETAHSG